MITLSVEVTEKYSKNMIFIMHQVFPQGRKHNMRGGHVSMLLAAILFTLRFHGLWDSSCWQFSGKPCDLHLWFELSQVTLGHFQGRIFLLLLCWIKKCMNTAGAQRQMQVGLSELPVGHSSGHHPQPGALEKQSPSPSCCTFFRTQEHAGYILKIKAVFLPLNLGSFWREQYVC